jgi:D-alanyl-D-alanine carboxypeptidase/D-alanyl-D-alanine-endopeptidase (penicillin-binding protein 4)
LHLYDGSGLAPTDRTTARFIVSLLAYMATQSPERESFRQSLPRAGMEGSVRNFLKNTSLEGKARLKSGSMSRTRGYAGFVERDGKHYALAIFLNNYDANVSLTTKGLGDLIDTLIP